MEVCVIDGEGAKSLLESAELLLVAGHGGVGAHEEDVKLPIDPGEVQRAGLD